MGKKFELTDEYITTETGTKLSRIRALKTFGNIIAGEFGGFVEQEKNLSQESNAWVCGNAEVYGDAEVCGNAEVYGDAEVCGNAEVYGDAGVFLPNHLLVIGSIGSRNGFTTFYRSRDKHIMVKCGCFDGTLGKFLDKVTQTHGDNHHAAVYRAAAEVARLQIDLSEKAP